MIPAEVENTLQSIFWQVINSDVCFVRADSRSLSTWICDMAPHIIMGTSGLSKRVGLAKLKLEQAGLAFNSKEAGSDSCLIEACAFWSRPLRMVNAALTDFTSEGMSRPLLGFSSCTKLRMLDSIAARLGSLSGSMGMSLLRSDLQ